MTTSRDKKISAWIIALMNLKGVGSKTLVDFLSAGREKIERADAFDADFAESLTSDNPKARRIARALHDAETSWENQVSTAYETIEIADERSVTVLNPFSDSYPRRLLRNSSYPPVLYCKGSLDAINAEKAVAIIGTRNPTDFGMRMGRRFAQILAEDGYVVVSGLAVGCDTLGHEGALDVGGVTVAVLPTPICAPVYPGQNQGLANRIVEAGGALLSEYGPGVQLSNRQLVSNLVARDEWQPALSDGVTAIETSVGGGTRHAVEHALRTGVPLAVFDYRENERLRPVFETDPRFGGNMKYLTTGRETLSIYGPETIETFKDAMDVHRKMWQAKASGSGANLSGDDGQQTLPLK